MRKIIWLTRAVLEKPLLLLVDEQALILQSPKDPDYLKSCMDLWAKSTVLCRITSFEALNYFTTCLYFKQGEVAEYDKTSLLLANPTSLLHNRMLDVDSRMFVSEYIKADTKKK